MAQTSYFWGGTTVGDATLATYSAAEHAAALAAIYGGNFVISDYASNFDITPSTFTVGTGAAVVFGYVYTNDAVWTAAFDAQGGGQDRIDRVVLRVDAAAQTVRLTIIKGVAGAAPALPALGATDMPLYYVYLRNGFGAGSQDALYWQDERQFGQFSLNPRRYDYKNRMPNAEFLAYSGIAGAASLPDQWTGAVTSAAAVAAFSTMPRGRGVRYSLAAGNSAVCFLDAFYDDTYLNRQIQTFTLKGAINVWSGNVKITVETSNLLPGTNSVVKYFFRTGTYDFTIRGTIDNYNTGYYQTTPGRIVIERIDADADVDIGELILVRGHIPGPFRQSHQYVPFNTELTDATWTNNVIGIGLTTVDLNATFSSMVQRSVRNVLMRLMVTDSAGAAKSSETSAEGFGLAVHTVSLSNTTNNTPRESSGVVPVAWSGATHGFRIRTDSNSSSVTIKLVGILT